MLIVLRDSEYTFDAANKKITLVAPYDTLSLGQVISIIDLTTKDLIYASDIRGQPARSSCTETGCPISIAAAVITHTYANPSHADADKLQIIVDVVPAVTDSDTGTTTNDYANVLEWSCTGLREKSITVKNTGGANTLTLKVNLRAYPGGSEYASLINDPSYELDLAPDDIILLNYNNAYAVIDVLLKSKVAATHTTYRVDRTAVVSG